MGGGGAGGEFGYLKTFPGYATLPLDRWLLPESDPAIQAETARLLSMERCSRGDLSGALLANGGIFRVSGPVKKRRRKDRGWPGAHERAAGRRGNELDWWSSLAPGRDVIDAFPGLLALGDRELDSLRVAGIMVDLPSRAQVVDLSQDISRQRATTGMCPCVSPGGPQVAHVAPLREAAVVILQEQAMAATAVDLGVG